jgi:hypothetical protein
MHAIASQDDHAPASVPSGKQQDILPLSPSGRLGMGEVFSGITRGSHEAITSASSEFPHWYYPLERYINYGVDQAECAVEGIGRIGSRMDEFERVHTEIHASIKSQTDMLHSLFDHFSIDTDA